MTCRIDRFSTEQGLVLYISGRLAAEDLDVVRTAFDAGRVVAVELAEVEVVSCEASGSCRSRRPRTQELSGLYPGVDHERTRGQLALRVVANGLGRWRS
jgi:hypothetical protein